MTNDMEKLLAGMRAAGAKVQLLQANGFKVERKANNDLLTEADVAANTLLKNHLTHYFPQSGWLSEESVDDLSRLSCARVFIVDPIDGTIEFAKGIPEYAISVALVEEGDPVMASVYNPAKDELFYAEKGKGAWLNGERIHCNDQAGAALVLLASRSEDQRGEWDRFKRNNAVNIVGSIAYKLALVAAGKAHATFSLGPKNEWDIAAGVMLVQEAGGVVTTRQGAPLRFNQEDVLVDSIVASSTGVRDQLMQLIAS